MSVAQEESLRDRKKTLRRHLMIEIARGLISANGLRSLKVRDVAEDADCIREFDREPDGARLAAVPAEDPVRQLHGLAESYLTFAADHANLLRSLFEHRMEDDRPFPEDILLMVMQAFALMHEPLVRLLPGRNPEEVALLARMMFSAVHGIISLGLEERMVAVPPEKLRQQLAQFVDTHLAGLGVSLDRTRDGEV